MVVLLSYMAVAAAFYFACVLEIGRSRTRSPHPQDSADRIILHLVALVAALLWLVTLPVLVRVWVRRLRPRQSLARAQARLVARLPHRRARLAS